MAVRNGPYTRILTKCLPSVQFQEVSGCHLAKLYSKQKCSEQAGIPSMFALLFQRHLCWLDTHRTVTHLRLCCTENLSVSRSFLQRYLQMKHVASSINFVAWKWMQQIATVEGFLLKLGIQMREKRWEDLWEERRECRHQKEAPTPTETYVTNMQQSLLSQD